MKASKKSASCLLLIVSYLAYSSTTKMEAICSSETSESLRTSRHYTSEVRTVRSHRVNLTIVTQTGLAKLCAWASEVGKEKMGITCVKEQNKRESIE
jgi:hypothetical protein